jgi:hypothetical protein
VTSRTTLKISFALAGLILFGLGIRFGNDAMRWAGFACVGVAWFLRFWKDAPPPARPD